MGSFDTVIWQAVTVILTLLLLVTTVVFWRTRGPASGLRMLAVALLPAAAYLTGTLRLLWEIGSAVVSWAARLTFSPLMWLGLAIAATSVLLFVVSGVLRRRAAGTRGPSPRAELPRTTSRPAAGTKAPPGAAEEDDDLADIEAILRRHGIS